jgi:hypothetical protein
MPFNLLLLPLLGGYIFVAHWNGTRFTTPRYSGERLIFRSAIVGVLLLIVAVTLVELFERWLPGVATSWRTIVPFKYSGTSLLAFFIGALSWWPLNRWVSQYPKEARKAIAAWNDFFEMLLSRALTEARLVSVTLRSRKVYIGFVTASFDPANERKYIVLLPLHSGYRDEKTMEMVIQTNYAPVYAKIIQENNKVALAGIGDFRLVIPVGEVQSLNLFDPTAYQHFRETPSAV